VQKPILEYSVDDIFILIPARSGSKGVPRKNLQKINGKTLVEITIGQALLAGNTENIYLSSDSNEILQYAEILNIKSIQRTSKESSDESDANSDGGAGPGPNSDRFGNQPSEFFNHRAFT
jgi:CMP-N-acetylneuraminic acid synthetase